MTVNNKPTFKTIQNLLNEFKNLKSDIHYNINFIHEVSQKHNPIFNLLAAPELLFQ